MIMAQNSLRVFACIFTLSCDVGYVASAAEQKSPNEPAANGAYSLTAKAAELNGKSIQRNEQGGAIERWSSRQDRAEWNVSNQKMGNYDVAITWSVAEQDAPQAYNVQIDHRATIRAYTVSTGGKFKREVVGRIMLAPGVHAVTFFPNSATRGGLCKLKQIELVPVANLATIAPQKPVELHVPDGFEVTQVAGQPLTSHPMLACFDDRGRLYVTESTGVNADASVLAQSPPHEIRVLEDTDGDGNFNRSTVFADKLTMPQGIVWHDGSIYTSSPPNFWRLTDVNGDDVADERKVLVTGFPFRGMSDDMHGGSLGRDGRLYFAAGRFPHKIQRPNGPVIHEGHNPLIVRCRPDGSQLEVYCGAMGNAVGVDFSDAGDCFASGTFGVNAGGKRDSLNHCIEGGAYPVHGQAVTEHKLTGEEMPNLTQFGASASSDLAIYRDEVFGPEYRGNLFSAMFNMHKIARHLLEPDGATFRCHNEDFLTSPNADFHPTDVLESADGSLIVVDTGAWFLIGCPTSVIAKPQISGGIYRIRRSGTKPIHDPWGTSIEWDSLNSEGLVKLLDDTRFAVRDCAMRKLAAEQEVAVPTLQSALSERSAQRARLNALWTLARIDSAKAAAAARVALADHDDAVRQAAATTAGLFRDREAASQLVQLIRSDKSSPVRREAAASLGRIGNAAAVPALLASLFGVNDRFLEHALILAIIRLDDREQTLAGFVDSAPQVRRGALIALDQMDHGNLSQADVTRTLETDDARVQQAALNVISRHAGWANQITELSKRWLAEPKLQEDRQSALRGVLLAFIKDPSIQKLIAQTLAGKNTPHWTNLLLLDVIGRGELSTLPRIWQQPMVDALHSENTETVRAAITAIASVNQSLRKQNDLGHMELLALARSEKQPRDLRVAAAAAALPVGQPIPGDVFALLVGQCRATVEPVTRLNAASVIGSAKLEASQRDRVIDLIAKAGPLEMPALMRGIENSEVGPVGRKLIAALGKSPGFSALSVDRLAKLRDQLPADVRSEADLLLKRSNVDLEGQRQRLEELKDALVGGDPARGRSLFFGPKASCSACHRIGEEGGNIGPNLAGIAEIRTRRDLLEAVAFPSASIARNFEPYTVLTKAGSTQSGIISRTTGEAIYLITTERTTVRIPRSEIEVDGIIPSKVSIMPQGLDRLLQPTELKDLLAFLGSLREQKLPK
jgi:putative membrane-bound dehydrogenase-like protein